MKIMKILNFLQEIEIQSDMPMVKIGMINSGIRFGITHNYKNTDYSMFMLYGELIGEGLISCVKDYVMRSYKEYRSAVSSVALSSEKL